MMSTETSSKKPPLWKKALVIGLILVGVWVSLVFTMRVVRSFQHARWMADRRSGELDVEMIRDWMPVPYIERMYGVPQSVLYESLGISAAQAGRKNLAALNRQLFPGQQGEAVRRVKEAIRAFWAEHPAPNLQRTQPGTSTP